MIDWLTATIFLVHWPIPAGSVMSIHPDGTVEWESLKKTRVRGSFESSIQVRSQGALDGEGRATQLYIDGNPAKFLQGHNVFGSSDLTGLLLAVLGRVVESMQLGVLPIGLASAKVHRLDFTHSFQFDSRNDVRAYIRSLGLKTHARVGRPTYSHGTCYFGKTSRRWTIKVYSKGDELDSRKKGHALPDDLPHRDLIYSEADRLARVELTLRGLELKRLDRLNVHDWTPTQLNDSYREYVGRIDMTNQLALPTDVIQSIRRAFRDTYFLWEKGIDPSTMMPQNTFYRHRRELLPFGVDIAIPCDRETGADVIPLVRMLEGRLYEAPTWAYEEGMIFQPPRKAA